jgi:hypothetical protein
MMEQLEWPECDAATVERDEFDARVMTLLADAAFVAFVPVPAPLELAAGRVEAASELERMLLPHDGLAWLCSTAQARAALRPVFEARVPELSVMAFNVKPSALEVFTALNAKTGRPAESVLFFDDGILMAIRSLELSPTVQPGQKTRQ